MAFDAASLEEDSAEKIHLLKRPKAEKSALGA
jgi:hypothetical protein